MSWLFSQALVEEYLEESCLDGEPSAQLNGNHTQQAYCSPDKMTEYSRLFRFGMMFKPLTESRGEELLMSFRAAFPVKTYPLRGGGKAWKENGQECGKKWHGLLARFDLDTHLWRTAQCSLLEDLNESLQTLPQWGMTVGGELYLLPTLVQTIKEKESGLWLTPSTVDIPTRSAESMEKRLEYRKKIGRNGVGAGCLSEQVEWSGKGQPIGYITKETWPTPRSCSAMAATITQQSAWNEKRNPNLETIVGRRTWGTPKAQDSRHALRDRGKGNLGEQVSGLHNGGKLNPLWTEWLMGWPIGWTGLKRLETDKCHFVQQQHGKF
jgi:hypothetical protein